jgi:tetrahydromethanopterin S-methyltransferase subunit A
VSIPTVPKMVVTEPGDAVKLDKAGYFVIVLLPDKGVIDAEHYAYDNTLLRVIEGSSARALYAAIINGGWVMELSHAAYLGKELAKDECSLRHGCRYVQDGA